MSRRPLGNAVQKEIARLRRTPLARPRTSTSPRHGPASRLVFIGTQHERLRSTRPQAQDSVIGVVATNCDPRVDYVIAPYRRRPASILLFAAGIDRRILAVRGLGGERARRSGQSKALGTPLRRRRRRKNIRPNANRKPMHLFGEMASVSSCPFLSCLLSHHRESSHVHEPLAELA